MLIVLAIVLRFYRLADFATFLSDQGRDAIIIKRIVTLEHWPAIGAPASVGQIYLGPFYYYLMAPFLALFRLDPVGLAYGSAFLSVAGLIVAYALIKKFVDAKTALVFLFLASVSEVNIEAARFSWNPNPLPIFAFVTLFFFFSAFFRQRRWSAFLFGAFFGLTAQLHYLALLMATVFLPVALTLMIRTKARLKVIGLGLIAFAGFGLASLPLIAFDLRHQFLNSRNFLTLFSQTGIAGRNGLEARLGQTANSFINTVFAANIHPVLTGGIFLILILAFLAILKTKQANPLIKLHWSNFLIYWLVFSLINVPSHPHYFGPVYFSFFLIVAYALGRINQRLIVALFLVGYLFLNLFDLAQKPPGFQLMHSRTVADFLGQKINHRPFNIATWPVELTEDNYLYFLELQGMIPSDRRRVIIADQLFVLCNQAPCRVLDSPSWNISMFGPGKIDKIWTVAGIKIYRIVHAR